MNELIKDYLQKTKEQELIKRGLCDTKYFESKELTKELRKVLDYSELKQRYYKKIPYEVTEEEYNEILKVNLIKDTKEPILPITFNCLGALIFLGGGLGGYSASQSSNQLTWTIWLVALFAGMTFLGFGKIIKLLNSIKNK